jgi:hypothetical protein
VEDNPEGITAARVHATYTVLHVDAIRASRAPRWPMANREDHTLSLAQANDLDPRLHARALLGEYELAACKINAWLGEQKRDLERKYVLAINVLMQTVVIVGVVAEHERRWLELTCVMAALEE